MRGERLLLTLPPSFSVHLNIVISPHISASRTIV